MMHNFDCGDMTLFLHDLQVLPMEKILRWKRIKKTQKLLFAL